jgi:hypothetical protein
MKVTNITKIDKNIQCDISTATENFYVKVKDDYLLLHNSPAVFAGIDPTDGKFFVAKKGIFNKEPKVYKSVNDVKADTSGDLQTKLIIAFEELSKLGIKGVVQGDIMFTAADVKSETIDDQRYLTFHPNTIMYAVPAKSTIADEIRKARIGVVFHTEYSGNSFESMQASYGVDIARFKKVPSVWARSATLPDLSGKALLSKEETAAITKQLSEAGKIFLSISSSTLKELEANRELATTIETYGNSLIRQSIDVKDAKKHTSDLVNWVQDRFNKEAAEKKTEKGKAAVDAKRDAILKFFSDKNRPSIEKMFELQILIRSIKQVIIKKLEEVKTINTFVKTKNGFRPTNEEGYVAIDRLTNKAVKIVDRLEFSALNFSPNIIKGWDR